MTMDSSLSPGLACSDLTLNTLCMPGLSAYLRASGFAEVQRSAALGPQPSQRELAVRHHSWPADLLQQQAALPH